MDKKTVVINVVLVVLICVVGIGFASVVFLQAHEKDSDELVVPREDVPFMDFQKLMNQKVSQYDLELSLFQNKNSDFDYAYSGKIDVLHKSSEFSDFENIRFFDSYSMFQSYITEDVTLDDDQAVFELNTKDQTRLLSYLNEFISIPLSEEIILCRVLFDADQGYLLEVECTQGDYSYVFVFDMEQS